MRIIRRWKALFGIVVTALLLAGCGSGPSQVGAAAIVGDRAIPVDEVQQEIQWLLDNVPQAKQAQDQGKLASAARRVVRGRIVHELVDLAAQREGLRPDEPAVAELIGSAGGPDAAAKSVQVLPARVHDVAVDQVLLQQLAERYLASLSVSFVGTVITSESPEATAEEQAMELGRKLAANPEQAQALVQDSGQAVAKEGLKLADAATSSPALASSALFGAEPGTVVVLQPGKQQKQTGWLVALITDRQVSEPGDTGAAESVEPRMLYRIGLRMLQPIANEVGVKVNPRYGVWDPIDVGIAPRTEELAGHQLASRTVRP